MLMLIMCSELVKKI